MAKRQRVEALGLKMIELPINPTGMSIGEEMKTLRFLYQLYRKEQPDIVHHVGLKTILWGGLAAKWAHTHGVVNAVSGLGVLFSNRKPGLKTRVVMALMKYANNRSNIRAIFQNHEDEDLFVRHGIIRKDDSVYIKGSGVDLNNFAYTPPSTEGKVNIIFTARMVKEKGILVLVEAAEMLRNEMHDKAEFWLCGGLSNNPKAISQKELNNKKLTDEEYYQLEVIGATFENITLDLIRRPDQWLQGWSDVQGADKSVALVADVYTANSDNIPVEERSVVYEGVGPGCDLYVVVEIDGYLYLMRGAVFSYREFERGLGEQRMTDEEWQKHLKEYPKTGIPSWMEEIIVPLDDEVKDNEYIFYSSGC